MSTTDRRPTSTTGSGSSRHRSPGGALSVLLAVGLSLCATACSSADDESPRQDPASASPSAAPTTPNTPARGEKIDPADLPKKTVEAVETGGQEYFRDWTTALAAPEKVDPARTDDLSGLEGAALEELLNTLSEYQENDWRVTGRPQVLSTRVVEATQNPDTVTVVACVDNSSVRLLDARGKEVPNSRPPHPRTRNVMVLVPRGDGWVVGEQRPATRPNC